MQAVVSSAGLITQSGPRLYVAADPGPGPSQLYEWDDDVPYAYVDPEKTTSGTGTIGNPYNPTQAMAIQRDPSGLVDRVIVWLPGTLNITGIHPDNAKFPYLTPTTSGNATARIIHKASNTAADAPSEERTYINRTSGNGSIFGAYNVDYIIWDGFWSTTSGLSNPVGAPGEVSIASFWMTDGSKLVRCNLDAANVFFQDGNHAVLYFEQVNDLEIADNYLANIGASENNPVGNNPIVMTYNAAHVEFHHNTLVGPGASGYYAKGQRDVSPQVIGHRVHHNRISGVGAGVVVGSPTQEAFDDWMWVYQNVITESEWGVILTSFNPNEPYGIAIVNNTIADGITYHGAFGAGNVGFGLNSRTEDDPWTNGNIEIRNNIFYNVQKAVWQEFTPTVDNISWSGNGYNTFTTFRQIGEGGPSSNFAAWQAETPARDPSPGGTTASPLFVNAAGGDFTLQPESTYRDAVSDFLNLRGNGTSGLINRGAYITSDMSDVIGRRN